MLAFSLPRKRSAGPFRLEWQYLDFIVHARGHYRLRHVSFEHLDLILPGESRLPACEVRGSSWFVSSIFWRSPVRHTLQPNTNNQGDVLDLSGQGRSWRKSPDDETYPFWDLRSSFWCGPTQSLCLDAQSRPLYHRDVSPPNPAML
jgi:hypothetical protein